MRPPASGAIAMTPSGTSAATITSACCSRAPGASTRNSGIENSVRSNVACSRIVGSRPKRRKMSAQTIDGSNELDGARIRGKAGIVRVRAAEHQRLHARPRRDAERAAAVARADQRAERQRNRAKHALLHEARLQRYRRSASAPVLPSRGCSDRSAPPTAATIRASGSSRSRTPRRAPARSARTDSRRACDRRPAAMAAASRDQTRHSCG